MLHTHKGPQSLLHTLFFHHPLSACIGITTAHSLNTDSDNLSQPNPLSRSTRDALHRPSLLHCTAACAAVMRPPGCHHRS